MVYLKKHLASPKPRISCTSHLRKINLLLKTIIILQVVLTVTKYLKSVSTTKVYTKQLLKCWKLNHIFYSEPKTAL